MDFLKHLKNRTLLIVPSSMKMIILEEIQKLDFLPNVKILSFQELLKKMDFDYKKAACIYLSQNYNLSSDIVEMYMQNMYFLNDSCTVSVKLKKLIEMKDKLFEENLIYTDHLFIDSLKSWDVVFYGYDYFLKEEMQFINYIKTITHVDVYKKNSVSFKQCVVHRFQTIEEELEYVFQTICNFLASGVSCNQIKIANLPNEYHDSFIRFAKFYNLPVSLSNPISLYETQIGKQTIQYLKKGLSFVEIKNALLRTFQEELINQIIDIFNQYTNFSSLNEIVIDWIIKDMKEHYLKEEKKIETIDFISFKNYCHDPNNYVFVLGFNNKNFPRVVKDEDFINDREKVALNFTTSEEKNRLEKSALIDHLFEIENLIISYKLSTPFEQYYPSILIKDLQMIEITEHSDFLIHYSKIYDTIKLTNMFDQYIQLGKKHSLLEKYSANITIPYKNYQHQFQDINSEQLKSYLNSSLTLSYSSIDRFFHCQFRYYLQDILKISKFEESLSTIIGNVSHAVLAHSFDESFDFEKAYQKECQKYDLTAKEQFYLEKLKAELSFVIQTISSQNLLTGFNHALYEEKFVVKQPIEFSTNFVGFIDKILWKNSENGKLVSIIDYKTGSPNLDLRLIPVGLNLQLPIYMYLLSKSSKFHDCKIVGIYLQKILSSIPPNTKDLELAKRESLKLYGYSLDSENLLEQWDPSYENSDLVKGLKKTKNGGWYAFSKVLNEKEIERIIQIVDEKIREATQKILVGDFSINPKRISFKNVGCDFCEFHDICYHKEEDFVDLQIDKDLSFLARDD